MHVKVLTFRLATEDRSDEAYAALISKLARTNVTALRNYGLLDGYVVRASEDTIITINFYESSAQANAAFTHVTGSADYAARMNLELIAMLEGPAVDLPMSYSELGSPLDSD
jgi:hypothetical protein